MELNIPEVLGEVAAAFDRYERALNANDISVLDGSFWASPHTIRYGLGENLYGRDQVLHFRKSRPVTDVEPRWLLRTRSGRRGRQTQTWARTPEGWRVVSAHVSWFTP